MTAIREWYQTPPTIPTPAIVVRPRHYVPPPPEPKTGRDPLSAPAHTIPAVPWSQVGRFHGLPPLTVTCEQGRCVGGQRFVYSGPAGSGYPWPAAEEAGWRLDELGRRGCPACQEDLAWRSQVTHLDWPPVLWEPHVYWVRGRKYLHLDPVPPPPARPVTADTITIDAIHITSAIPAWTTPPAPVSERRRGLRWPRRRKQPTASIGPVHIHENCGGRITWGIDGGICAHCDTLISDGDWSAL
jgi:hypothetical protein